MEEAVPYRSIFNAMDIPGDGDGGQHRGIRAGDSRDHTARTGGHDAELDATKVANH